MGQLSRRRSIVALNLSQKSCVNPIDFVASFFVEILPDIKALSKEDDAPIFKEAIALCQLINKRIKKHNYSRNALISLIKAEFLESRQISDLRGLVGETPFCMFPDELEQSMLPYRIILRLLDPIMVMKNTFLVRITEKRKVVVSCQMIQLQ